MRGIDPLIRGIYYMHLLLDRTYYPLTIHIDKKAEDKIKEVMGLYNMPLYRPIIEVRNVLVKELLRNQ